MKNPGTPKIVFFDFTRLQQDISTGITIKDESLVLVRIIGDKSQTGLSCAGQLKKA